MLLLYKFADSEFFIRTVFILVSMSGIIYLGIGVVLGSGLFYQGFVWFKQKQLIENIPTSKVRSIAMGLVEIHGDVVPIKKQVLKSPFTNKDCVYYRFMVEEYRKSGKHSRWITVRSGRQGVHFGIKDNTGTVLVDPKDAHIDVPHDNVYKSGIGRDPPKEVKHFLKAQGLRHEGFFGLNKKMRFTEWFIKSKEKLYIMGTAGDNPFKEEATALHGVEDIMIQKGKNEKFYYISNKHEGQILTKLKWQTLGGILGGAIITIISLVGMFIYIGLF